MHIVCPHCTTSYAINLATLGATGRTVRCSRCKAVWLARPEDAVEPAPASAMVAASPSAPEREIDAQWTTTVEADSGENAPRVDSPSLAGDFQSGGETSSDGKADWIALVRDAGGEDEPDSVSRGWFSGFLRRKPRERRRAGARSFALLPFACAAMGALIVALMVWRVDVVRLLPQTAAFYKMVGLDVNLRGLAFKDVKVTTETVEGKPVLVIEGEIVGETKKTVELPRLRFSVRDAQGTEIYAWNSVLEETRLKPGDHASFKSRLASPPAEGRSIDVRFFNKHDIAGGSA